MRVIVIGGTGNISQSIVKRLVETGHDVTCFNRGLSGTLPRGVRQIIGDRRDRSTFERTMQDEQFDACIDMICFTQADAQSNVRAFRGVSQLIHCSTVCTYGVDYDWMPVTEDHPLRPITGYGQGKVAADAVYLGAYYSHGFPVTIIKPSTTYGPKLGLLRQIALEYSWIDRIRKGKPILVCGNGKAPHQFLHVDDAAKAFVGVLGKKHCIGQTYNMCKRGFTTWEQYHRTAMDLIGRQVELVGIPMDTLATVDRERFSYCVEIFAHNCYYSPEKLYRDVPEFVPSVSLEEGMGQVLEAMDREGRIPDSDSLVWEDRLIEAQRSVSVLRL